MKIQRANYLQTLAFPAYFSVLTKGKRDFIALRFLCHIVLHVTATYFCLCLASWQLHAPDVSTEVFGFFSFSHHQLIRDCSMKFNKKEMKQNDDHAFSWPDEHLILFLFISEEFQMQLFWVTFSYAYLCCNKSFFRLPALQCPVSVSGEDFKLFFFLFDPSRDILSTIRQTRYFKDFVRYHRNIAQ